jgi:hypothetical protein
MLLEEIRTNTENPSRAELIKLCASLFSDVVSPAISATRGTTDIQMPLWETTVSVNISAMRSLEERGNYWKRYDPETILMVVPLFKENDSRPILKKASPAIKLIPERRELLEGIRALRTKIGPVPFKIGDLLREIDEENG